VKKINAEAQRRGGLRRISESRGRGRLINALESRSWEVWQSGLPSRLCLLEPSDESYSASLCGSLRDSAILAHLALWLCQSRRRVTQRAAERRGVKSGAALSSTRANLDLVRFCHPSQLQDSGEL